MSGTLARSIPFAAWSMVFALCLATEARSETGMIELEAQTREDAGAENMPGRVVRTVEKLDPAKTAIVIVDVWDKHWCKTYTERVGNLVPRMNKTLDAARKLGIQVVHAPSDVLGPYKDTPQRKAMQAIPEYPAPEKTDFNPPDPPGGRDCCECGPSRPCQSHGAWSSEHPGLRIAEEDLIADCNNGREVLNLCQHRGLDTLLYMGVASNMCLIGRSAGMIEMKRHGLRPIFVADLVEAITANGCDPATKAPDPNFTPARGTAQVQRHLERYIAPSIQSRQIIAAAGMDSFAHDKRPHVVFVIAEEEYGSDKTLPAFAEKRLKNDFRCSFVYAKGHEGADRNDVPGLEVLLDADLLFLSMRRRALPVTQMDHLEWYIRAGKPIVGVRVSIVPFQVDPQQCPEGHVVWRDFDQEVLGCHYQGYPGQSRETGCDVWVVDEARDHPILRGVKPTRFHSASWLYNLYPLADTTTLLMKGRWAEGQPEQPVAFTNTYNGARVFYTSLGHPKDFENEAFCRMLANAVKWALQ